MNLFRTFICALSVSVVTLLGACGSSVDEKNFVGKWRSSKLATPIYLHANGDWEIKTDDGGVLQYGVWKVKNRSITWSYKLGGNIGHDWDPIVSLAPREFLVKEHDGSVTRFTKLN